MKIVVTVCNKSRLLMYGVMGINGVDVTNNPVRTPGVRLSDADNVKRCDVLMNQVDAFEAHSTPNTSPSMRTTAAPPSNSRHPKSLKPSARSCSAER